MATFTDFPENAVEFWLNKSGSSLAVRAHGQVRTSADWTLVERGDVRAGSAPGLGTRAPGARLR